MRRRRLSSRLIAPKLIFSLMLISSIANIYNSAYMGEYAVSIISFGIFLLIGWLLFKLFNANIIEYDGNYFYILRRGKPTIKIPVSSIESMSPLIPTTHRYAITQLNPVYYFEYKTTEGINAFIVYGNWSFTVSNILKNIKKQNPNLQTVYNGNGLGYLIQLILEA